MVSLRDPSARDRDLHALPKAHLHLHFTGSMRHATRVELAARDGIVLPDALVDQWPPQLSAADEKGWFRFQRLYDVARSVLRTEDDVRRLVREAAEDDVADGGRWLEIQVDPSGYAARFGGITAFTDLVLDAVREASRDTGLGIAVVVAANSCGGHWSTRASGSTIPSRAASSTSVAWRIDPVKCRCRCALGSACRSRSRAEGSRRETTQPSSFWIRPTPSARSSSPSA